MLENEPDSIILNYWSYKVCHPNILNLNYKSAVKLGKVIKKWKLSNKFPNDKLVKKEVTKEIKTLR